MRHPMGAIPFLMAISPLLAPADQLPAYCGAVGAKSYTPPSVTIPAVVLNRGTVITVTNNTVVVNGDTSSVKALMANPGPDGISLQEAIMATNNDPGAWNIQFAPALKGSTIVVNPGLPSLTGGNVTINGDIDGDGQPDITLTSTADTSATSIAGVAIQSWGNTIYGLALQNFTNGVFVGSPRQPVTGATFSGLTISNLVMTNIQGRNATGIWICPECGPVTPTAPRGNTWDHVLITGNTITGSASGPVLGISVQIQSGGNTLQHTTIANNNIVLRAQGASGISLNAGPGPVGTPDQGTDTLLDTRVIRNTITAPEGIIFRGSFYDGAQVIGNQISSTGLDGGPAGTSGITFFAADVDLGTQGRPGNGMKNLAILANTIEEGSGSGIGVHAGQNATANNAISNVVILGNTVRNPQTAPGRSGIYLLAGSGSGATANSVSNVLVQANTVQSLAPPGDINYGGGDFRYAIQAAGISVYAGNAGLAGVQGNNIDGIAIANNDVNTPSVGIAVTGGYGTTSLADNNVVSAAQIFCNQVDQVPTLGVMPSSGIKGINVAAGEDVASGNQVQQLYIADNLVAGTLGGASTFANLGAGGSGNTLNTSSAPTPAISSVANAEGESPLIAPNTWIEIKGVKLAPNQDALNLRIWGSADFVNNQMPVQLDGVSVTVNGKNAYVWYVSPSQVNVLTPPDALLGPVNVVVTNNGVSSTTFVAQAQALSPSFFVFDGTHVAATHLDGTYIGPTTLYPGSTSPAKPGETIVIYGNGFGATSTPVVSGAITQSGTCRRHQ